MHERCPFLYAAQPVFVAAPQLRRVAQVVEAVESVVALPGWREAALAEAPQIARRSPPGPRGAFLGYDFHLEGDRLGLIEINTNAGGAMLNAVLARAQRASCRQLAATVPTLAQVAAFEQAIVDMFRAEWRLAGRDRPLQTVAIVDEAPGAQYLYPEFLLFARLFERHGLRAVVADPAALEWQGGALRHEGVAIDLVYNRLTDFYLEQPASAALREAHLEGGVVLTPDPRAHALYADKRRLATLVRRRAPRSARRACRHARGARRRACRAPRSSTPRTPSGCGRRGAACSSSRWPATAAAPPTAATS